MENFIRKNYPNAEEGIALTARLINRLINEEAIEPKKTLMATSVCSDEIIRSATNFRDHLEIRQPFQLGGLAGYPFAGLTGLKAFAAHIPDGGSAIILYGPHIGVSRTGEVGTMQRHGQMLESSCCGALQASLGYLDNPEAHKEDEELDYQIWKIGQKLVADRDEILRHPIPLVQATDKMYTVIDRQLDTLLKASGSALSGKRVVLIGGIIINTDHDLPDWFDLRRFETLTPA